MPDYLYEKPPLIEVIAEIHWRLEPLEIVRNAGIDPYLRILLEHLGSSFAKSGLGFTERLVPEEFPSEMLAHKPMFRYRPGPNTWPVYQVGPGIFTVNMVPPYDGWKAFAAHAREGLSRLLEAYPMPEKLMTIQKLDLRYLDAYTAGHGMKDAVSFIRKLGISVSLPRQITEHSVEGGADNVAATVDARFQLKNLKGSSGILRVGGGRANNQPAVIVEMRAQTQESLPKPRVDDIWTWFDVAHNELRQWFEWSVSDDVRATFGTRREVEA